MTPSATAVRLIAACRCGWRAALMRWRDGAEMLEAERTRRSWFDQLPGALAPPRSAEEIEAENWDRQHFRINGRPSP